MAKIKFIFIVMIIAFIAYAWLFFFGESETVTVVYIKGKAYIGDKTVILGDAVPDGVNVKLSQGAKCFLQMPGGAIIKLSSRASMEFKEEKGEKKIQLKQGKLACNISKLNVTAKLPKISTPHADMIPDSTDFNISIEGDRSIVSVHQGTIHIKTSKEEETIDEGKGTYIQSGQIASQKSLPEKPEILSPKNAAIVSKGFIEMKCRSIYGTRYYQWECSPNPDFTEVVEERSRYNDHKFSRPSQDGKYYIRVRAINSHGNIGEFSERILIEFRLYKRIQKYERLARNYFKNPEKTIHEAIKTANEGLAICPDHVQLQKILCLSYLKTGNKYKAVAVAKQLKKNKQEDAKEIYRKVLKEIKKKYPSFK